MKGWLFSLILDASDQTDSIITQGAYIWDNTAFVRGWGCPAIWSYIYILNAPARLADRIGFFSA